MVTPEAKTATPRAPKPSAGCGTLQALGSHLHDGDAVLER